jgi:hypothetical protein
MAAVTTARKAIPSSITKLAMIRPMTLCGVTSPYPTVVTVWIAHHMPTQIDPYSVWSRTRIRMPATTTTTAVAVTMTPAASRTEGGLRRRLDIRLSIRRGRGGVRMRFRSVIDDSPRILHGADRRRVIPSGR